MNQITGTVEKAWEKALVVGGVRYGCNFNPEFVAGVEPGDTVQIEYQQSCLMLIRHLGRIDLM